MKPLYFIRSLLIAVLAGIPFAGAQVQNEQMPLHYSAYGDPFKSSTKEKIAIIGAGPGGSSAAYYLQKFTNDSEFFDITIFEKSNKVGGRTTTVNVYDNASFPVELGASIYVNANKILRKAQEDFSLKTRGSHGASLNNKTLYKPSDNGEINTIGIWNGEKFVFQFDAGPGASSWVSGFKFLYKYGVSPIRTVRLTKKLVKNFVNYYYHQYFPFSGLQKLSYKTDFISYTNVTGLQYLTSNKVSEAFSKDIIQSLTRVNYVSNLDQIHGLETLVSVAAEDTYQVIGGNWQIFENFVKASKANLLLNASVTNIELMSSQNSTLNGKWKVYYGENSCYDIFDQVIIAAPFYQTGIKGLDQVKSKIGQTEKDVSVQQIIPFVEYVTLHVTLFTSKEKFSRAYFKLEKDSNLRTPDSILTTINGQSSPIDLPFFSISTLDYIEDTGEYVYKIFSPEELSKKFISARLLGDDNRYENFEDKISWIYKKVWKSYPKPIPRYEFSEFRLHDGLWYLNTMETFISTMETSALAGANVAALITEGRNKSIIAIP